MNDLQPGIERSAVLNPQLWLSEARRLVPEAFDASGKLLPAIAGRWPAPSNWFQPISPIDGKPVAEIPVLDANRAGWAVEEAAEEFEAWSQKPLKVRAEAVAGAVALLKENRDLLIRLLAWEIGKTLPTASNDVDRCLAGAEWYLGEIGPMLEGRRPLGLVSNIASWNYPFSVLLLNILVQALCGNSVIAKIPTLGGGVSLTVAHALLRRFGLPVTLVGGRGCDLTEPLVSNPAVKGLSFVGGRKNGATVGERVRGTDKQYSLELEGVNAYLITHFSDWAGLEKQIRSGFDFGKQRCTAYTRWVVEKSLVPRFLETYLKAVSPLRVGNPLLGIPVDFGPVISADKAQELHRRIGVAKENGATVLLQGELAEDAFAPGQDRSAYLAPVLLTRVHPPSDLYSREPFGPVDSLVVGEDEEALVREANVSQGALVASVATDDPQLATRLSRQLLAFKVGINRPRSRGDRDEPFGGTGGSWEGAFMGGIHLVQAFTDGPGALAGRWPT